MSLIGKLPIKIPEGVSVNLDNQTVVVTGPKGELRINLPRNVFFFQAEDGIRDIGVTGVQTCALPI